MTHKLLSSRNLISEKLKIDDLYEFGKNNNINLEMCLYETTTNQQGGLIYLKSELENYIQKYFRKPELDEQYEITPLQLDTIIDRYFVFALQKPSSLPSQFHFYYDLYALYSMN